MAYRIYRKGYFGRLERQKQRVADKAFRDTAKRLARHDVQKRTWIEIGEIRKREGYWPDIVNMPDEPRSD